jgi:hypothetical protein
MSTTPVQQARREASRSALREADIVHACEGASLGFTPEQIMVLRRVWNRAYQHGIQYGVGYAQGSVEHALAQAAKDAVG